MDRTSLSGCCIAQTGMGGYSEVMETRTHMSTCQPCGDEVALTCGHHSLLSSTLRLFYNWIRLDLPRIYATADISPQNMTQLKFLQNSSLNN